MSEQTGAAEEHLTLSDVDKRIQDALRDFEQRLVTKDYFDQAMKGIQNDARTTATQVVNDRFAEINRGLDTRFQSLQDSIDNFSRMFRDWREAVDGRISSRDETVQRLVREEADNASDIEGIRGFVIANDTKIKLLSSAVHGDPDVKEGAPSLFAIVSDIRTTVKTFTDTAEQKIAAISTEVAGASKWQQAFDDAQALRKARWDWLKKRTGAIWSWVARTKWFQALVAVAVLQVLVSVINTFVTGTAQSDWLDILKDLIQ